MRRSPRTAAAARGAFTAPDDLRLWEALRAHRLELARRHGVPPYVVFHDATLAQMVEQRPQTREAFARLSGVGAHKLEAYADEFLGVIRAHGADAAVATAPDPDPVPHVP